MIATFEMPATATKIQATIPPKSRIHILLVDDDAAVGQILLRLLTEEDYGVQTARNSAEALEIARTSDIDLMVLDLKLPTEDGVQALENILSQHPLLPVILIAAHPSQFLPARDMGVGALLEKPLDFVELFSTIRRLLHESDEVRPANTQHPWEFQYVPLNDDLGGESN